MSLSAEKFSALLKAYPQERRHTLAVLQDIHRACGYLPKEHITEVARYLKVPLSEVYAIATFYRSFSLKPRGKYVIKVCDGMSCHIKNGPFMLENLRRILGVLADDTSHLFTVETVSCLGACAVAPSMEINGKHYGKVNLEKIDKILGDLYRQEKGEA